MKKRNCYYCDGAGPEPGYIETDNNGPIVPCPICNKSELTEKARRDWEYNKAELQRLLEAKHDGEYN